MSDDGFTLWSLESSGISFRKGSTREKILNAIINRSGISIPDDNELYSYVNDTNLGRAMHTFIQSIISISDMLMYRKNTLGGLFLDAVYKCFQDNCELYDRLRSIQITGKTKL